MEKYIVQTDTQILAKFFSERKAYDYAIATANKNPGRQVFLYKGSKLKDKFLVTPKNLDPYKDLKDNAREHLTKVFDKGEEEATDLYHELTRQLSLYNALNKLDETTIEIILDTIPNTPPSKELIQ